MQKKFDIAAKNYDEAFTFSKIGKAQRNLVHQYLSEEILRNGTLNILELNCGTGEDAIFFQKKGHRMLATDISEKMIQVAKEKCKNPSIRFQQLDITKISSDTFSERFDLIFSNFGGFNCINRPEIEKFIEHSPELLNPSGKMVLVIMSKKCLWERSYFILKGQLKKAFRRNTNKKVFANVDGTDVPTWYYQPKEIIDMINDLYDILKVKPIGIWIPPSYLEPYFQNKKRLLKLLIRMEGCFKHRFWAGYADHYLIAFQKK